MSKNISHNISAALGLRLPFHAGSGLTYSATDPKKDQYAPVTISSDRTVVLAAANAVPIGSLVLIEVTDGTSSKCTVEVGPIVRFKLGDGVTGSTLIGKAVIADGDGGVKLATGAGLGTVTAVEGDMVYVLTYGNIAVAP